MKKSNMLMTVAAAAVALVAVTGVAFMTYAQTGATNSTGTNSVLGRMDRVMMNWANLTDEQKTQLEQERTTREAERTAQQTELKTAIAQGYSAWVAYVKKYQGENAAILSKVNEGNFAKFAEAYGYQSEAQGLQDKARAIYEELGINGPGMGFGMMAGKGGRFGGGKGGCPMFDDNDANTGNTSTNTNTQ